MQLTGLSSTGVTFDSGIITSGLIMNLDVANLNSYPGSGATIYNTVTGTGYSITGTQGTNWSYDTTTYPVPTLALNNNSTSSTGGISMNSFYSTFNTRMASYNFTIMYVFSPRFYGVAGNNVGDSQLWVMGGGYNEGARLTTTMYGTPGTAAPKVISWGWGATSPFGGGQDFLTVDFGASYGLAIGIISCSSYPGGKAFYRTCSNGFFLENLQNQLYTASTGNFTCSIGYEYGGVGSLNGYLALAAMYDRPLSQGEMIHNYGVLKSRYNVTQPVPG